MANTSPQPARRWSIPIALMVLTLIAQALPILWNQADLDPAPLRKFEMAAVLVTALAIILLLVWFFLLAHFSTRVRLAGLGILLLLAGAGAAAIQSVDVTGGLGIVLKYRWEPAPVEQIGTDDLPSIDLAIDATHDFPRYRGVHADGLVTLPAPLATDWEKDPPRLLWRRPCGGGFAGFAVAGNVAITLEQRGEDEAVVCYDRTTGQERWAHAYRAHFKDLTGNGPRSTPTIAEDGRVYTLGAVGDLLCLDGKSGKPEWATNVVADSGARVITWGMTSSPLLVDEMVVVNAGIDPANNTKQALAAYNRRTGKRLWATGEYPAGYSSPQLATLAGQRQILLFDAGGLAGFDVKSGAELWRYPWETYQGMNIVQPLVLGPDRVLISSELANGTALLRLQRQGNQLTVETVWANRQLGAKFSNPILLGSAIYGLSNGTLVCLDAATGKRHWRGPSYGHGQILGVGGHLLILSERGYVALVTADARRFRPVAKLDVFTDKTWNTHAIAGRQLFVRNHVEMACFELPTQGHP